MEENDINIDIDKEISNVDKNKKNNNNNKNKGEWLLNLATIFLSVATILITLLILRKRRKEQKEDFDLNVMNEQYKLLMLCTITLGILLWPVIWKKFISFDMLANMPLLWTAFLYPVLMMISDVVSNSDNNNSDDDGINNNCNSRTGVHGIKKYHTGRFTYDAVNMLTIAVAIGSYFSNMGAVKLLDKSKTLISVAIMLIVIFVLPTPISHSSTSPMKVIVSAGQKVVFNYAIAFLIAAGLLHFQKKV